MVHHHILQDGTTGRQARVPLHYRCFPLLPPDQVLVLDLSSLLISLLSEAPGHVCIMTQCHLSPSGMCAVQALVEHYPTWCPYEYLLNLLYPQISVEQHRLQLNEAYGPLWDSLVRPVRRIMEKVNPLLALFGIGLTVLPRLGYQLIARADLEREGEAESDMPAPNTRPRLLLLSASLPSLSSSIPSHVPCSEA